MRVAKPRGLQTHTQRVTRTILRWYTRHGRTLPWRNIRNPYRLLIAEVMLHQTQVSRVRGLYTPFLKRFPTLRALASARQTEVMVAWRGMGYNNRAVRLHRLARQVVEQRKGNLPVSVANWQSLPGIGKYTAHALVVSIRQEDLPVVDANIRRVLSRLFWVMPTTEHRQSGKAVWDLAERIVPRGQGYRWMQALMDLGASVCTARSPRCPSCPAAPLCASSSVMKKIQSVAPRPERSLYGVPNRLYRGRIVETLRSSPGGIPIETIGRRILGRYSARHASWLRSLILGLKKDGVVAIQGDLTDARTRIQLA
jgi:A/G-specific adenine glycosylase